MICFKDNNPFYKDVVTSEHNLLPLPVDGLYQVPAHSIIEELEGEQAAYAGPHAAAELAVPDGVLPFSFCPTHVRQQTEQQFITAAVHDPSMAPQWPTVNRNAPIDELHTVGYIACAFPYLFSTGAADLAPQKLQ